MNKIDLGNVNNEKIEELNLVALRKYACPKISNQKDWYLKCMDCPGLKDCRTGKRAMDILNEQTKPAPRKFDAKIQKILDEMRDGAFSKKFVEALEFGFDDPSGYLMQHYGFKQRWRANDAMKRWLINHGIPVDIAYKPAVQNKIAEKTRLIGSKIGAKVRVEKTRDHIANIFEGCKDTDERLRNLLILEEDRDPNLTAKALSCRLYTWASNYPDLSEKYKIRDITKIVGKSQYRRLTISELRDICFPEDNSNDEVSISDFLEENSEADVPHDPGPDVEIKDFNGWTYDTTVKEEPKEETPKVVVLKQDTPKKAATDEQNILLKQFSEKRRSMKACVKILDEDISKLNRQIHDFMEKRSDILKQIELLDQAALLFNMRPVSDPASGETESFATKTDDIMDA